MPRARKKPVEIAFEKWDGSMDPYIEKWLGSSFNSWIPSVDKLEIITLEGIITASPGDFIIKGVHGEFYPCKPDIFAKTYDVIEDEPRN